MLKNYSFLLLALVFLSLASAGIDISKTAVNDIVIEELSQPAVFNIKIINNGSSDVFRIYTLVSGIEIKPEEKFSIENSMSKEIEAKIYFDKKILENKNFFSFEYRIIGEAMDVVKDVLSVKVYNFETAFPLECNSIHFNQKEAVMRIKNKAGINFENIHLKIESEFFDYETGLSLAPSEEKSFSVLINQEKLKKAVSGNYLFSYTASIGNSSRKISGMFNFEEKTEIKTEEHASGILIRKSSFLKINQGNVPEIARVVVKKDVFSGIFTSSNINPSEDFSEGFSKFMVFEKELQPAEQLSVIVKTNYLFPVSIFILFAIGIWAFIYYFFQKRDVVIKKKASLVKTKRGEFAMKISLHVKALKPVEKLSITEGIPRIVKLYDRFGSIRPDRIDNKEREIEWDFESLEKGEEKILSYVIYSKIGIFGEFTLPKAKARYYENSRVCEAKSNSVSLNFKNE